MNRKYLLMLTIAGFIVAIDQASKLYVHSYFGLGESVPVIPNFFHFTYVRNMGAAFGMFSSHSETFRELFFLSMPPVAMAIILLILRGVEEADRVQVFALSCIFGGAIGNYIDRLKFRYVIDFLDFHMTTPGFLRQLSSKKIISWPAFNVADVAIVAGVLILAYLIFNEPKEAEGVES
ncbi:MAG: signal peptidase II [Bdellovibrionaceae bacterium]|nr:signal peptidase II [Pseudobdellovibrionaceae bacterium]